MTTACEVRIRKGDPTAVNVPSTNGFQKPRRSAACNRTQSLTQPESI
jgi:hypothetical protein